MWLIAVSSTYIGEQGHWMINALLFARSWQLPPSPATPRMEGTVCAISRVVTWLIHFVMGRISNIGQMLLSPDAHMGAKSSVRLCLALFPTAPLEAS